MTGEGKTVFVTGGAGYIGSHSLVELLNAGYEVIVIDNFVNSVTDHGRAPSISRVEKITGKKVTFYECDLLDSQKLLKIFKKHHVDCVIHFAAIKAVGESMKLPLYYYKNNMIGTINLLEAMESVGCYQLVFSSSCCVYGDPEFLPITEDHPTGNVTNVYGRTKFFIEEMLKDLSTSNEQWNIISLRYFNPLGAHPSGLIGEDPTKEFSNIMPYISQVALGNKPFVTVFGNDYDTIDGTGIRDYIHVMDLAAGHVAALTKLLGEKLFYKVYNLGIGKGISVLELIKEFEEVSSNQIPTKISSRRYGDVGTLVCDATRAYEQLKWKPCYNLGTGRGYSVLELVKNFEKVTKCIVPVRIDGRREGDIVSMYANATLARTELKWFAKHDLNTMCEDFWRWQTMNPNGYKDECTSTSPILENETGDTKTGPISNQVPNSTCKLKNGVDTNGTTANGSHHTNCFAK